MLEDQAIDEVGYLKTQFTGLPKETGEFWFKVFLKYPQVAVHEAIDQIAMECGDFLDKGRPKLLKLIAGKAARHPDEVRSEAIRHSLEAVQREKDAEAATRAAWDRVDREIARISDEELEALKTAALSVLDSRAEAILSRRCARTNPVIRGLIFKLLEERKAVGA